MIHPKAKTPSVPISTFFIADMTVEYDPRMSKMKLPEIPGKIIAQMAINPETKINQVSELLPKGGRIVR